MKLLQVITAALLLAAAAVAVGKTITVTTTVDENDGSCVDGDCSFRDAIIIAASGDIVMLPQGVYHMEGMSPYGFPSLNGRDLAIIGAGPGRTVLDGQDEEAEWFGLSATAGATVNISNLTITRMFNFTGFGGEPVFSAWNGSTLILKNCVVSDSISVNGVAVRNDQSDVIINSCAFIDNSSSTLAGAIRIEGGTTTIINSLIAGNESELSWGGGIYISSDSGPADVLIRSSTIVDNQAQGYAGIYIEEGEAHMVRIANTVIADNWGNCSPGITSLGHNIDSGISCGFAATGDQSNTDPELAPLVTIDGMPVRVPLSGSPVLDAGSAERVGSSPLACAASDQRGLSRPQGRRCDIGAVEVEVEGENARILVVPAYDFAPRDGSIISNDGYNRFTTTGAVLEAPIQLPSGASITAVGFQGCDDAPSGAFAFALHAVNPDGTSDRVSNTYESGFTQTPGCGLMVEVLGSPHTVNNSAHGYSIQIGGTTSDVTVGAVRVYYRLQISPAPATATFNDVPVSDPFFKSVEALAASGITGGCGGGNFCPDAVVTREQMAAFLARALGLHWPN